jgi:hypothetical protein
VKDDLRSKKQEPNMHKKPNSTIIIVICGLVALSLLGCSVGRAIVKGPQPPTATPTATHRPTFTATISPTPRPTATSTPEPTLSASPPAAVPGAAAPPSTPFVATIVGGVANCSTTGVFGFMRDAQKMFVKDAYVRVWTDKWEGVWAKTGGDPGEGKDRNYELKIADKASAGTWHVAVVNGNDSTENLSPVVNVTSTQSCEGDGAVQWMKVDFTKQF